MACNKSAKFLFIFAFFSKIRTKIREKHQISIGKIEELSDNPLLDQDPDQFRIVFCITLVPDQF